MADDHFALRNATGPLNPEPETRNPKPETRNARYCRTSDDCQPGIDGINTCKEEMMSSAPDRGYVYAYAYVISAGGSSDAATTAGNDAHAMWWLPKAEAQFNQEPQGMF